MARSLPLSAYLALRGADDQKRTPSAYASRPRGTVIWAICSNSAMLEKAAIIEQALLADGDQIHIVKTSPANGDPNAPTPQGRREIQGFLDHWKPALALFIGDTLDPLLISHVKTAGIACFLVEATAAASRASDRHWIPGLTRAVLNLFEVIVTVDDPAKRALLQIGATPTRVQALGIIEASMPVLPYHETERQDFARTVGTRPVWLAAETGLTEIEVLARAHHQASRRSHKLLLIIALRNPDECDAVADVLRESGFDVAIRNRDQDIVESTQIYVVDGGDELGLWYRAAPVSYLGETLRDMPHRHPCQSTTAGFL